MRLSTLPQSSRLATRSRSDLSGSNDLTIERTAFSAFTLSRVLGNTSMK